MWQPLIRFLVGGFVVSLFAAFGDVLKPKSFAGLFAAAPSVALATLGMTMLGDGKLYAAAEGRSMIGGAAAFCVYAMVTIQLIMRFRLHAVWASIGALAAWMGLAVGIWLTILR